MSGVVIIGGSQAGVSLAANLREKGFAAPVTIIEAGPHLPYQRPPLSKDFLSGGTDLAALELRDRAWYQDRDITLALGSAAQAVRRDGVGGVVTTADGVEHRYERLVLATGARARRLELPGADLEGVHCLRDLHDAERLARDLERARNVVVVGGGFIGLEIAAGARDRGATVTVLEAAPRIIGRAVGEETSEFLRSAHQRRGIDIRLNAAIDSFQGGTGRIEQVMLGDGQALAADVVVIGVGVVPRTELAEQLGLEVDGGVVVDAHALASDGRTLAIGDVANLPNPYANAAAALPRLRLESIDHATHHAQVAAATILGTPQEYSSTPWFWSHQGDLRLQMVGLNVGFERTVVRGDPARDKFTVLYYRDDDTLLAADCLNSPADFMVLRRALSAGRGLPAQLAATDAPLKALLASV